ncbi:MAG TPA: hypothetical protein VFV28_06025 [Limnobacter sp.]|nr:hypothetical protein [Limnobacter sp.]
MSTNETSRFSATTLPAFWVHCLVANSLLTIAFGLVMALLPAFTEQAFGWAMFNNPGQFELFPAEAREYIKLAHAVMGSVVAGWALLMLLLVRQFLTKGLKSAWNMLVASLLLWFIPDTAMSLHTGFWQNAVLNTSLALGYALPLLKLRRHCVVEAAAAT